MSKWVWVALGAFVLMAIGCGALASEAIRQQSEYMVDLVSKGVLSTEQAQKLMEDFQAVVGEGGAWWEGLLGQMGETLLTLCLGYVGIRKWRGSPADRKGLAPWTVAARKKK